MNGKRSSPSSGTRWWRPAPRSARIRRAAYARAIANETDEKAKWVLETILENAEAAEKDRAPLCDDTGIPHLLLEVGQEAAVSGYMLDAIREGVAEGLRKLPGPPDGDHGRRQPADRPVWRPGPGQRRRKARADPPAQLRGARRPPAHPHVRRRAGHPRQDLSRLPQARHAGRAR